MKSVSCLCAYKAGFLGIWQLNHGYANDQHVKCQPLSVGQTATQDELGKHGRGQNLQLVSDLIGGHIQVARSNIK